MHNRVFFLRAELLFIVCRLLSMGETEFLNKSLKISRNSKVLHDQYIHVFITLRLQLLGSAPLHIKTHHLSFDSTKTVNVRPQVGRAEDDVVLLFKYLLFVLQ